MADVANLGFAIDTSGLNRANRSLEEMVRNSRSVGQATGRVENSLRRAGTAAATASTQVTRFNGGISSMGGSFRRFGPQIQNASFQLQDIVVQLQSGTSASRALGQQLPQLLGGFGPLGAVLGLVAGAAASLAPLLYQLATNSDDAADSADKLSDAMKTLQDDTKDARLELEAMVRGLGSIEEVRLENRIAAINRQIEENITALAGIERRGRGSADFESSKRLEIQRENSQLLQEQIELEKILADVRAANEAQARADALATNQTFAERQRAAFRQAVTIPAERQAGMLGPDRLQAEEDRARRFKTIADQIALDNKRAMDKMKADAKETERVMNAVSTSFEQGFTRALDGIVSGTKTASEAFRDMATSIINDIARIALQESVTKPLGGALSDIIGNIDFSSWFSSSPSINSGAPGFRNNANGNAFNANGVVPFADGGVVTRPTVFPFANGTGLMGEAGPEAILPLRRGPGGKLGVEGGGGGSQVVVNIRNETGGEVETQQTPDGLDIVIRAVAADIAGGGRVFTATRKAFQINPPTNKRG